MGHTSFAHSVRIQLANLIALGAKIIERASAWRLASLFWCWAIYVDVSPDSSRYQRWVRSSSYSRNYNQLHRSLQESLKNHPCNTKLLAEQALACNDAYEHNQLSRHARFISECENIDIVICVYNAYQDTMACIDAILTQTKHPFRLIIVDDASDDDTRRYLEKISNSYANTELIVNPVNLGYTRSANIGLKETRSQWTALLNSDTIVGKGWLEKLLECARTDTLLRGVGPLSNAATFQSIPDTHSDDGRFAINRLPEHIGVDKMNQILSDVCENSCIYVPILNGFCTLFHRKTIESLGFFREDKFPRGYGEENDLCLRMLQHGYRLAVAANVYVYHKKSASFGSHSRDTFTRDGVNTLKALWPDYSYGYISDRIGENRLLCTLRREVKRSLDK